MHKIKLPELNEPLTGKTVSGTQFQPGDFLGEASAFPIEGKVLAEDFIEAAVVVLNEEFSDAVHEYPARWIRMAVEGLVLRGEPAQTAPGADEAPAAKALAFQGAFNTRWARAQKKLIDLI
jgi:hypothetical protein